MPTSSGQQSTPNKETDPRQKKKSSKQSLMNSISRQKIIALLTELGPMTMREIADQLKTDLDRIRSFVGSTRQKKPGVIYIQSYRRDEDGGRLYPRAVWAAGNLPDAKRPPKLGRPEYNRRSRKKKKKAVASIFHLHLKYENNQSKLNLSKTFNASEVHLG